MSRLEAATARLEAAIGRLDDAARKALEAGTRPAGLQAELDRAKQDHARLARVADEVGEKLDHTIGRLKFVLEG